MKKNDVLFITLKVFSATGGIEKVCRVVGKALYEYAARYNRAVQVYTMHGSKDAADGNRYFPAELFRGFNGNRIKCILSSVRCGSRSRVVMLSHINLLVIGWMIKKISPSTKIILFSHGIEVWRTLDWRKTKMLHCCDEIIAVSKFTADKIQELHHYPAHKIKVLNNSLDPFLSMPGLNMSRQALRSRYGFSDNDLVLFTLTRLSSKERYKGYDKVMEAIVVLKEKYPSIRYLLAGSYDAAEKAYLDTLISSYGIAEHIVMTGFIPDEEVSGHFSMSDIYVMPSVKEGFGIVFIEAMYYGLPVIAGNIDGSVDALCNGKLGLLVDPLNNNAIQAALEKMIANRKAYLPDKKILMEHFSYDNYKIKLDELLLQEVSVKQHRQSGEIML